MSGQQPCNCAALRRSAPAYRWARLVLHPQQRRVAVAPCEQGGRYVQSKHASITTPALRRRIRQRSANSPAEGARLARIEVASKSHSSWCHASLLCATGAVAFSPPLTCRGCPPGSGRCSAPACRTSTTQRPHQRESRAFVGRMTRISRGRVDAQHPPAARRPHQSRTHPNASKIWQRLVRVDTVTSTS